MPRIAVDTSLILDAAYAAVNRIGVRNLTMADIADTAGVSRYTLYRRFQTKDELISALGDHLIGRSRVELLRDVQAKPDPDQRVKVVVEGSLKLARIRPLEHLIELEPSFFLGTARRHFREMVNVIAETLVWPNSLSKSADRRSLTKAGEAIFRISLSQHIVPPQSWKAEERMLIAIVEALLRGERQP